MFRSVCSDRLQENLHYSKEISTWCYRKPYLVKELISGILFLDQVLNDFFPPGPCITWAISFSILRSNSTGKLGRLWQHVHHQRGVETTRANQPHQVAECIAVDWWRHDATVMTNAETPRWHHDDMLIPNWWHSGSILILSCIHSAYTAALMPLRLHRDNTVNTI